jgi:hypothetical protein
MMNERSLDAKRIGKMGLPGYWWNPKPVDRRGHFPSIFLLSLYLAGLQRQGIELRKA